jgi:formyltetrahydrofolate-dependent phosphoribosylglycinamide formyltransferase
LNLDTQVIPGKSDDFDSQLTQALVDISPDLVCLAGFMRKVPLEILSRFRNRVLNIHPALLPSFGGKGMYGHHVHEAVLAHGCKVSGCTVHFVDEEFDTGPIILQQCVAVLEGDTPDSLGARVLKAEHQSYSEAVRRIAQGRITINGRQVQISPDDN